MTIKQLEALVARAKAKGALPDTPIQSTISYNTDRRSSILNEGRVVMDLAGRTTIEIVVDDNDRM